jgi:FkbM family methyltransferase
MARLIRHGMAAVYVALLNRLGLTPVDGRTLIRAVRRGPSIAGDPMSYLRWMSLLAGLGGSHSRTRPHAITALALRPLGARRITVRLQGSDAKVLLDAFVDRWHVPPSDAVRQPRVILDLGAAIGVTMAHYAVLYPSARIVGVELDAATARLARINLAPWADRCSVVTGAIWPTDGTVAYGGEASEQCGFRVGEHVGPVAGSARALSVSTLLDEEGVEGTIDFLKMDIEGAEARVLTDGTDWAQRVRTIYVETHAPYSVDQCAADLAALGFAVSPSRRTSGVLGTRAPLPAEHEPPAASIRPADLSA